MKKKLTQTQVIKLKRKNIMPRIIVETLRLEKKQNTQCMTLKNILKKQRNEKRIDLVGY